MGSLQVLQSEQDESVDWLRVTPKSMLPISISAFFELPHRGVLSRTTVGGVSVSSTGDASDEIQSSAFYF